MDFTKIHPFQLVVMGIFVALAIISIILFSMCGGANARCGGGVSKAQVGTVVIWGTVSSDAVDSTLNALKVKQTEFSNVSYVQKSESTFGSDLAEALASGGGPDVVLITQEELLAQKNKLVEVPFSSFPQRQFVDSFLPIDQLFMTDKGVYGIPVAVDPLVLYYNKPVLASAGVASPPASWEAVTGLAPTITHKSADGSVQRSLIPLGEYSNVANARALLSLLFLQSGSSITSVQGNLLRSTLGNVDAQNSYGVAPAEASLNFYAQFANPSKTVYTWNRALPEARQAFLAGDLALYPGFASEAPVLKESNPNLDFDMAVIPQPSGVPTRVTYAKAYALALTKQSKNQRGGFTVAYTLGGKDYAPALAKSLSMAPALRSALTPGSDDLYAPVYYPEALIAKGWLSPAPGVVDGIFSAMINDIDSGRRSAHDALFQADQALSAALTSS